MLGPEEGGGAGVGLPGVGRVHAGSAGSLLERFGIRLPELLAALRGCGCFPAGTAVATPHGSTPIEQLKAGDQVLAEDPSTGKVEPERVSAVIDDGVKPTMRVGLSDGSAQQVTTNHPFYVDGGPGVAAPRWVQAGDLRLGDRIRTEDGQDITVAALRYNTGNAHVYTLTVATDHDFFVGAARVLVHNCLGDLTSEEVIKIQAVVDQAGVPLDVIGSAARGTRRNVASGFPLGKGAGTQSDIDYIASQFGVSFYEHTGFETQLPGIDSGHGVLSGLVDVFQGPAIRSEPHQLPRYIPQQ